VLDHREHGNAYGGMGRHGGGAAEKVAERGFTVMASCIWRWVRVYGPEIDKRCRPDLKRTNRNWRHDSDTYRALL
jgi:transposase-like protein